MHLQFFLSDLLKLKEQINVIMSVFKLVYNLF